MAIFTGSGGADFADSGVGSLIGFSGGSIGEMLDPVGDVYICLGDTDAVLAAGGDDTIEGGVGSDTLNGGGGADRIYAHTALDFSDISGTWLKGAGGNDLLVGSMGDDTIEGDADQDTLEGGGGADLVNGGGGNDSIMGGGEKDTISGGAGNDTLTILDGEFIDDFNGGSEIDMIDLQGVSASVTVDLAAGTWSVGGLNSATLSSVENVTGGAGPNALTGGATANELNGGASADTIDGGDGNDTIRGGAGADSLVGGAGTDLVRYENTSIGVTVNLLTGTGSGGDAEGDVIFGFEAVFGGVGDDSLAGSNNANTLFGYFGDDTLKGDGGADTLEGGGGADIASYQGSGAAVTVNLETNAASGGDANNDTLIEIEGLAGSSFNDTLTGSNAIGNDLRGSLGNDSLSGLAGNDKLDGGAGNDTLKGGSNPDILVGGAGADVINGGSSVDKADYTKASAGVSASLVVGGLSGDAAGDVYSSIEILSGSNHADTLTGGGGNDDLRGRGANDILSGGAGNDKLDGGSGNDTLTGGSGDDVMTGGGHNDRFDFTGSNGADVVNNFNEGLGAGDVLRIVGYGASLNSFAEIIAATTQVGADAVINLGGGNSITLSGVNKASLVADDFLFI